MKIFLVGVSCVGKSTIGEKLAQLMGLPFLDFDHEIQDHYDLPIEKIKNKYFTESGFREEAGSVVIKKLVKENNDFVMAMPPSGLQCGYSFTIKKSKGITIALKDTPENILKRLVFFDVDSKPVKKVLTEKEKVLFLQEIKKDISYFGRTYKTANIEVDIAGLNIIQSAEKIMDAISKYINSMNIHKEWEIRVASVEDTEQVCRVFKSSVNEICLNHPGYDREIADYWNENKNPENIKKWILNTDNYFIVAERNKNIDGVGFINLKKGELHACYLMKSALGLGLGKKMMSMMIDKAKEINLNKIILESSLNAKKFYGHMGFKVIKENINIRPPDGIPHYCMELHLKKQGNYLWHGGSKKFDILKPAKASDFLNISGNRIGVYATNIKNAAIAFALGSKPDKKGRVTKFIKGTKNIEMVFIYGSPNIGGVGYLYKLSYSGFKKVCPGQYVCDKEVIPLEIIEIKTDDYKHLYRNATPDELKSFKIYGKI